MTILQGYIARSILMSTLLVLFILLGLYSFMDFVNELDELGKGNYQLVDIMIYMALSMPKRLYELLPIAALLGSVLGLGNLASQSELVVMRAAGLSVQQISKAVLIVAIALMVLAVFIGEVIRPPAEQSAREQRSMAQTGTVGHRSEHGFWTRDGLHFNHIKRILPNGHFSGISIYEFDQDNKLRFITVAKEAIFENDRWRLMDVVQNKFEGKAVQIKSIEHTEWESQLNPGMLNIVIVPPEFLPVWDLVSYIDYLNTNRQAVGHYKLALWTKIMMPFSSAVMVLLAVPFIFGPLRSSPVGGRILIGALVGIGFHLFNQSFQHLGLVVGVLPWIAAAFPTLVFALLGIYMMRKLD